MSGLTKLNKESIGLLSIGTFLEYFDLMLYVHMAVILNELFFPQTDTNSGQLLAAFAFCSTFVFRPIGALIFGYIGDLVGRKIVIIVTTMLMATSCLVITILPPYAQIGITASWLMMLCRVIQGMSSMGELIGAEIYLIETIKTKHLRYTGVSILGIAVCTGSFAALGIASLIINFGINWRYAFIFGLTIAVIGIFARTRLQETGEFSNSMKKLIEAQTKTVGKILPISNEKVPFSQIAAFFLTQSGWPISFYFIYIYCGNILKTSFGYSAEQVIHNNFIVSMFQLLSICTITFLISRKVYPLTIAKVILIPFTILIASSPYILEHAQTPFTILVLQCCFSLCMMGSVSGKGIYNIYFPVLTRFRYVAIIFSVALAVMYIFCSFGFIWLVNYFGYNGIYSILVVVVVSFGD